MNSSPFLPAAPSTLNVGADDPVRPSFDFPPHPVGADAPSSAHIFEPILFFLCQKEKNGFNLPRKERGQGANRCPEFDSENFDLYLSVASNPTIRKDSALCASPFGGAAQQDQRLRADRASAPTAPIASFQVLFFLRPLQKISTRPTAMRKPPKSLRSSSISRLAASSAPGTAAAHPASAAGTTAFQ